MDGKELSYKLKNLINESADSSFLDSKTTYDLLNEAAIELVSRTNCLKAQQSITTVASQQAYSINADYLKLYIKNNDGNLYVKYNNATPSPGGDTFLTWRDYEQIIYSNQIQTVPIPNRFSIIDNPTLSTRLSGTATATGSLVGGESVLTDSGANFSTVSPGDVVHNTTDSSDELSSDGIVLSVQSNTQLLVAMFNGTNNFFTTGDAYIIQPQGTYQLILDPPPNTSGHTATFYYIQKPLPVYSDYGIFRFPSHYNNAAVKYAAFLYKYRDRQPNFGDHLYMIFDNEVRKAQNNSNLALNRTGFRMNLKNRQR